ncbi:hypothetical protein A33Q_4682 [Indibacter alkaliphilus LW1]|uniref:Uncharacterized protein n=1 Tax=Indibacter alkaliphilus (strain CCUG 57479 / KCTC 22604 / LW1) TaxID=1189612 RepID=S2DN95_INDAL|nr:hypothetical protein A33Q_4682 [Indibacter alkaliphilus LW1]
MKQPKAVKSFLILNLTLDKIVRVWLKCKWRDGVTQRLQRGEG